MYITGASKYSLIENTMNSKVTKFGEVNIKCIMTHSSMFNFEEKKKNISLGIVFFEPERYQVSCSR